jgi:flagellar motility protein MotE (MotC chaperone)
MSARNAAQIVEQVSESLAVELLQKLPVDARASILGKMEPRKAARLTERMATGR